MQLDTVELNRPTRRDFLGMLAGVVGGVALSCAPKVPEPLTRGAISSPTPQPDLRIYEPTATVEPTITQKPVESTATPKPPEQTPTPELPRFLREAPVYGVYTGELMTEPGSGGEGIVGEILFSHLPDDRILVSYGRFKSCPDGTPITPVFLVSPNFVRGAGFQHESPRVSLVALLQSPAFIGGELTIKDLDIRGTVCKGNPKLMVGAPLLRERGKGVLLNRLTAMLKKADSRTTLEGITDNVNILYGRKLPEEPAK